MSQAAMVLPSAGFAVPPANGDRVAVVSPEQLLPTLDSLREDGFKVLTDIAAVDYLSYPLPTPGRFAVAYQLHDMSGRRRARLKVFVGEGAEVPTVSGIWKGANWLEREVWDQFGIRFAGHPNLKRVLNHHEFVGHPLRKDYPIRGRQPLSENDSLVDEMARRLSEKGLAISSDTRYALEAADPRCQEAVAATMAMAKSGAAVSEPEFYRDLHTSLMFLNLGPSHPAAHGTLRTFVALDGETIAAAVGEIGYLHRGFEKSTETQCYNGVIPYTDRLNYVSAMMNNFAFCKTIERMLQVETTPRCKAMRVIIAELSRMIDHLVCIGPNLVDIGALTNYWYLFNPREKVYDVLDRLTGARLTNSYGRIGGLARDFYPGCEDDIRGLLKVIESAVIDVEKLVKHNRIFLDRVQNICIMSGADALSWGWTGPNLRASGVEYDVRKSYPYDGYEQYDFEVPTGTVGDTYDRIFVRMYEIAQSAGIVRQALDQLPSGPVNVADKAVFLPPKDDTYNNIEGLMNHFKLVFEGVKVPAGEVYDCYEAANGELGFYVTADGSGRPYRNRCRPPSFFAFAAFPELIEGSMIADAVATLGSLNIIAGELDR